MKSIAATAAFAAIAAIAGFALGSGAQRAEAQTAANPVLGFATDNGSNFFVLVQRPNRTVAVCRSGRNTPRGGWACDPPALLP